jgi:hypothetical protein
MDPIDTINTCHSNSLKQDQRGGSKKLEELKFNDALTVPQLAMNFFLKSVSNIVFQNHKYIVTQKFFFVLGSIKEL